MCEVVLPRSSGHWAPNTLWKTNLSVFCHIFSLQQFLENKKNQLCNNFQWSAALQKVQRWTRRGKKANRKAMFSPEMWGCCHFREGGCVWWGGLPFCSLAELLGSSWACSALWLEFLSQVPLACGTQQAWAGRSLHWPGMDASGEMLFRKAETWE